MLVEQRLATQHDLFGFAADAGGLRVEAEDSRASAPRVERYTPEWNVLSRPSPTDEALEFTPALPNFPRPIRVGASWGEDLTARSAKSGRTIRVKVQGKMLDWERVRVPAGEFDAFRVRRTVWLEDGDFFRTGTTVNETDWYAPAVNHFVRHEDQSSYVNKMTTHGRAPAVVRSDWHVYELMQYQPGPGRT